MARKIFCDGCDKDLSATIKHEVMVNLQVDQSTPIRDKKLDLCDGCLHRLKQVIDPDTWTRSSERLVD